MEGEPNTVVGECHHDVPIFEHAAMLQFGADGMSADPIAGSYGCNSLSGASTGFRSLHFSPLSENTSIPSVPQDFLGRNVDMYRVVSTQAHLHFAGAFLCANHAVLFRLTLTVCVLHFSVGGCAQAASCHHNGR